MTSTVDLREQFPRLYALQQIDNEIIELLEQRREVIRGVKALDAKRSEEEAARDEKREAHKRAQVEHATKENELATEQAKLDRYQEQLNTAKDANEYRAFERQIETTTGRIAEMEERTIELLLAIDDAKETMDAGNAAYGAFEAEFHKERREAARAIKRLDAALAERKAARANQADGVEPRLLSDYATWRETRKTTMLTKVEVSEETDRGIRVVTFSCGECSINIRPQLIIEAQTRPGRHTCPSCFRLLWPPEQAPDVESE